MNRVARTIEKTGAQRNGDVELGNLPDENANVEDFVLREEAQADFSRLIERAALAPREREVIEHLRGGSSYAEIARQTGMAIGTVGATRSRAFKKLRRAADAEAS